MEVAMKSQLTELSPPWLQTLQFWYSSSWQDTKLYS